MKRSLHENGQDSKYVKRPKVAENASSTSRSAFRFPVFTEQFDKPFPFFRKPSEVGSFSQDYKRQFHHDRHKLRIYVKPAVSDPCFDLSHGYSSLIRKDESEKEYLNDMLRWVMHNKEKFLLQSDRDKHSATGIKSLNTDFLCWRGLLTKLLCTPYENREDWMIAVTKFRGTYYLCEFDTESKKQQKEQTTPQQDEMCYGGWKFEQYVTADKEGDKPDTSSPVNNNEGFCSVVRTRLESHSLVYGGEVDAWDPAIRGDGKYLELKTSRIMQSHRQEQNFKRFKLIKWWAQSFLLGISKIVCGFRDDDGIVHSLQDYQTQQIPSMIKDLHNPWHPNVCFNFLEQFLGFLKHTVTDDDPQLVHLLTWKPRGDVQCQRLERGSEYTFIPRWFVDWEGWDKAQEKVV
ncbi:hypothetical protein BaRGS_00026231 [Batillaria attramentaria]|uniref:Decapping nuclease n=1 Tax=Batillaria attramentaria TaxID=370345 RepID=A0ABD0K6U4_9CAEN